MNPLDDGAKHAATGRLPGELQAFEAALAQLRPRCGQFDRDRLMYLAGQASVRGEMLADRPRVLPGWFWPASSVVMTGVAATLLFMLVMRVPVTGQEGAHERGAAAGTAPAQTLVERSHDISSLAWRKRITDELLSPDSLAHAWADLPGASSLDVDEEILSSRSYKQLLDEAGNFRRLPRASHSPKSSG